MPNIEEMLTVRQAQELAQGMGAELSRQYISRSASNGRIKNCKLVGDTRKLWLIEKASFVEWLQTRDAPGRPKGT